MLYLYYHHHVSNLIRVIIDLEYIINLKVSYNLKEQYWNLFQ